MIRRYLGYIAILVGIIIFLFVLYFNSQLAGRPRTFSSYTLMTSSWEKYKDQFINEDGRVIDYSQNALTTSEGQSYAMLRAVWVDDKETFDLVWAWTQENLKRPDDNLFGWRWGEREDGSFGFLTGGGENSASDADNDIALALILASRRWRQDEYLTQAKTILNDLWEKNTAEADGKRYLVAGNWALSEQELVLNPSYFAPYAWRIFQEVDDQHDWESLIDPSYELLQSSSNHPLDRGAATGLPPDWVVIDRESGQLRSPPPGQLTTNYAFDAIRIPWRIALDYQWNQEPRARDYLENSFQKLAQDWQQEKKLAVAYTHDGIPVSDIESPEMYATALGYFMIAEPEHAKELFEEKILKLYSNDTNSFNSNLPYYAQNWLWFGAGLYNEFLVSF